MNVVCKKCQKKYTVDPDKIKGESMRVKCKACGSPITIQKPMAVAEIIVEPVSNFEIVEENEKTVVAPQPHKAVSPKTSGMTIKTKITLVVVLLVLTSLSIVGFLASMMSRNALADQAKQHLAMITSQKANEYDLAFERIKEEALGVASFASHSFDRKRIVGDIGFKVLMPWTGKGYGTPALKSKHHNEIIVLQRIGSVLKSIVANNPYLSLGYMGTENGIMVLDDEAVVDVLEGRDAYIVKKRSWYIDAQKSGKTIWTAPYIDAATKKLVVTCATPVFRGDKTMVGVVGFDVLLDTIQNDILTMDIGYNGYAFMVGEKGDALVRPGMSEKDTRWDETYKSDNLAKTSNPDFNNIIAMMIKGKSGVETYVAEGDSKYLAYAPLGGISASIGLVVSEKEVVKPAVTIQTLIIGIWVVVLLISVVIGLVFGNTITRPIKDLTNVADQISQGRIDLEVLDEGRKDEIGLLIKSFNRLIISLKVAMSR